MRLSRIPPRTALSWLIGVSVLASLSCFAFAVYLDLAIRSDATGNAVREMAGQADGLARQIEADVALFDLALREAAIQARLPEARDAAARDSGGQNSAQSLARVPLLDHPLTVKQIGFINVINEVGDVVADSRSPDSRQIATRPVNFAGRDYFQDQLKNPADTLLIGRPFATAPNQHAAIPISRRLTRPDGTFAGVVVAGVYLTWLSDVLSHPPPGWQGSVTIRRGDGTILMRAPSDPEAIGRVGELSPAWQGRFQAAASPLPSVSPIEDTSGGIRLFRQAGTVPLIVEVAETQAEIATRGRSLPTWLLPLPLIPALCALALGLIAHRLQRHAGRIEAAAVHSNDERMRLLATISHELRTPLAGILGLAELLRAEGALNDRQAGRLARLTGAGTSMRDIINRVIDITRPEEHVVVPVLAPCDLDILVRTCRGTMAPFAKAKGLRLTGFVDPSVPKFANLDRGLVEQVLNNLLMNAVNFTGAGTVELRLTADNDRLHFEIADSGSGIPVSKRHRLFRAYDRLDTDDSANVGSGLGLSITTRLVASMGGKLGQRDNPGGGSVFWVELPFVAPAAEETGPLPVLETPASGAEASATPVSMELQRDSDAFDRTLSVPSHLRILLADDMDVTRSVTADFLRAAGHAVTEVANGEAATREAREHDFDVILTDMRMPVVDGLEATRRIRMLPGYRGRTPVVLVTADLAARDRGLSGQAGVDLCLLKPFTRAELLDTVQEAARLTPVPDPTDCPILDATILGQLRESLGDRATEEHLRAASRRLDALSALLRTPDAARSPDVEDAVHDLAGVAGIMGMTALSVCLMRFHTASDRAGPVASLREMLTETALALRKQMPMANIA